MTAINPGATSTIDMVAGDVLAVASNGGVGQLVITPVREAVIRLAYGPSVYRQRFGPFAAGAQAVVFNQTSNSLDAEVISAPAAYALATVAAGATSNLTIPDNGTLTVSSNGGSAVVTVNINGGATLTREINGSARRLFGPYSEGATASVQNVNATGLLAGASGGSSPASVPGQPAAPTATAGDGTVSLAFSAPSDGGSAILEYGALLSNGNANTGNPSASPVSVASANGAAVTGQIRARNAVGWGPYSPASNSVTPAASVITGLQFSRRQGAPSSPLTNTSNHTQFNAGSTINNQLGVPVNKIRLGWINAINHAVNGSMIAAPRMTKFEVGISPPGNTGGARTLITFGGATQISVEPGAEIVSDEITLGTPLAAGASIRVMVFVEYETAPPRLPSSNINATDNTNELNEGGTGALASKAAGTTMPASRIQSKVILCPAYAIGEPVGTPTVTKRIGFYGDSITSGADDVAGSSTIGMAQRGCHAANVPWVAASTEGYSYGVMPAGSDARRFTLFPFKGCSHVISFLGVNDIRNRVLTPAQIYARMVEIKGTMDAQGTKLIISTIWPNTNIANDAEVAAGDWDRLNTLNQLIRDNNGVGYGFFELNALVRDSVNPNLWAAPSAPDGTHPGQTHHTTVANAITAYIPTLT